MPARPTLNHILAAAERIRPFAHRTPVLTCAGIDARPCTSASDAATASMRRGTPMR